MSKIKLEKYLVFILFLPVFLTVSLAGELTFNRYGGYEEIVGLTFPLSLPVVLLLSLLNILKIFKKVINDGFGFFYISISIILLLIDIQKQVVILSFVFFLSYYLFRIKYDSIDLNENKYFLRIAIFSALSPGLMVLILNELYGEPQGFITEEYAIYNYEQYFAFTLVLIMIIAGNVLKLIHYIILAFVVFLVSQNSENQTASLLVIMLIVMRTLKNFKIDMPSRFKIFISITLASIILMYPILMWALTFVNVAGLGDPSVSGFWARVYTMTTVVSNIELNNLIIPAATYRWFQDYGWSMHNQFMSIAVNYGGLVGMIFIFYWVNKVINMNKKINYSLLVFIIFAGSMVEIMNHPYLAYQIAFVFAAYASSNKIIDSQGKLSRYSIGENKKH